MSTSSRVARRRLLILDYLRRVGSSVPRDIGESLQLTPEAVRNDLRALRASGLTRPTEKSSAWGRFWEAAPIEEPADA